MSKRLPVWVFALALAASGCAGAVRVGGDTIGPGYVTGGGEWNTGGGISAVVRIFPRGSDTVVCGAWTTDRQSALTFLLNEDVIQAASVYAGKTRLVQNLGFMPRLAYADNLSGAQAGCVASSVPWRSEFANAGPRLRFPRIADNSETDDDGSGGGTLIFRETVRPAIAR